VETEDKTDSTARLAKAKDVATELARFVLVQEKNAEVRSDLLFKIIDSLDFSAEWHDRASNMTLGALYKELAFGWWGDVPKKSKKYLMDSPIEPPKVNVKVKRKRQRKVKNEDLNNLL
jgi:hypothetical protein